MKWSTRGAIPQFAPLVRSHLAGMVMGIVGIQRSAATTKNNAKET